MARDPARAAWRAADTLASWLGRRPSAGPNLSPRRRVPGEAVAATSAPQAPGAAASRPSPARANAQNIAPAHTDWLYHHLTVTGAAETLDAFRRAAAGAGVIPWHLDLDRLEEDVFLRLAAPPSGQVRTLSLEGARALAAELRDAVARRHALAVARVGHSAACCFDLHALVPVPSEVLRLGPDDPDALQWLWTHWGTTEALRAVSSRQSSAVRGREKQAGGQAFAVSFWAADWTPWRALQTIRAGWPGLRFAVRPVYELP